MNRFLLVPLALVVLVVVPFLLWGDWLESVLTVAPEGAAYGSWQFSAALVGMFLLVADLVLPIPTTSILAGLGIIYGPVEGLFYAVCGAMLAALCGYAVGRWLGRPLAVRWIGPQLGAGERAFARYGGWIVAASRWMPVLPEVISVSAGVSHMPLVPFLLAAFCGVLPHCAVFVVIGHLGAETPIWTALVSALIPIGLWFVAVRTGLAKRLGLGMGA